MNREDIIRMALKAGTGGTYVVDYVFGDEELMKFAALIAEDCAKRCEALCLGGHMDPAREECADVIREAYKP